MEGPTTPCNRTYLGHGRHLGISRLKKKYYKAAAILASCRHSSLCHPLVKSKSNRPHQLEAAMAPHLSHCQQ
jgi:hypothetical protein